MDGGRLQAYLHIHVKMWISVSNVASSKTAVNNFIGVLIILHFYKKLCDLNIDDEFHSTKVIFYLIFRV